MNRAAGAERRELLDRIVALQSECQACPDSETKAELGTGEGGAAAARRRIAAAVQSRDQRRDQMIRIEMRRPGDVGKNFPLGGKKSSKSNGGGGKNFPMSGRGGGEKSPLRATLLQMDHAGRKKPARTKTAVVQMDHPGCAVITAERKAP